jgi:uncharacterized protein YndB with AHSA1/START domain
MPDASGLTLHLERVLPAPPAVVFAMHAHRDQLARWWGPAGFTVPEVELDLREGGRYRIAMQPPAGETFHVTGEFQRVDPPRELSYTFRYEEPDPDDRETVVTFSLVERGGSTEVTVAQGPFLTEARRALHEQGWTDTLDRLAAALRDAERPPATGT